MGTWPRAVSTPPPGDEWVPEIIVVAAWVYAPCGAELVMECSGPLKRPLFIPECIQNKQIHM